MDAGSYNGKNCLNLLRMLQGFATFKCYYIANQGKVCNFTNNKSFNNRYSNVSDTICYGR